MSDKKCKRCKKRYPKKGMSQIEKGVCQSCYAKQYDALRAFLRSDSTLSALRDMDKGEGQS